MHQQAQICAEGCEGLHNWNFASWYWAYFGQSLSKSCANIGQILFKLFKYCSNILTLFSTHFIFCVNIVDYCINIVQIFWKCYGNIVKILCTIVYILYKYCTNIVQLIVDYSLTPMQIFFIFLLVMPKYECFLSIPEVGQKQ